MRIFRTEDRSPMEVLPAPDSSQSTPPSSVSLPVPQYYRHNWRTAQSAIASSREILERTRNPPGVGAIRASFSPAPVQDQRIERLLRLRRSRRRTLRGKRGALERTAEILERNSSTHRVRPDFMPPRADSEHMTDI